MARNTDTKDILDMELPERIKGRLRVGKIFEDQNGVRYTCLGVIDDSGLFVLNKWFNDTIWEVNVRLDSFCKQKEYAKESREKQIKLTKEMRNVEKYLTTLYDDDKYNGSIKKIIVMRTMSDEREEIEVGELTFRKHFKEVN